MSNQPMSDKKPNELGSAKPAPIAGKPLNPAVTAAANTAMPHVHKPPIESANNPPNVVLANTKHNINHNATCQFCGDGFTAKRPKQAKYCSSNCRRSAWLERNPEKARRLAESDKARLKAHVLARGGVWND